MNDKIAIVNDISKIDVVKTIGRNHISYTLFSDGTFLPFASVKVFDDEGTPRIVAWTEGIREEPLSGIVALRFVFDAGYENDFAPYVRKLIGDDFEMILTQKNYILREGPKTYKISKSDITHGPKAPQSWKKRMNEPIRQALRYIERKSK